MANETKTEVIKFRASNAQKYAIQKKALDYGFSSVSAFILWACLEEDHTEKGNAALTAALEKIQEDGAAALEKIRADSLVIVSDAAAKIEKAVSSVDNMERENVERLEGMQRRFDEMLTAAHGSFKQDKKAKEENFLPEVLPMIGLSAAVIIAFYIFQKFFR